MTAPASISTCREILDRSGSSFRAAFRLLPAEERDAMTAFYAFCRLVDDDVDEAPDFSSASRSVSSWRDRIDAVYSGAPGDRPVDDALHWAATRFGIRREHLELVLSGVERDLGSRRFETFEELYEYCYHVASAVGFVCVAVTGRLTTETKLYAELTGVAVQMTNILRDVGEDAQNGRIYLPIEDLRTFGVEEGDLLAGRVTRPLKQLLRFEGRRAAQFYDMAAAALPPGLDKKLFFAEALRETYARLLRDLEDADFPVFKSRVSLSTKAKFGIALKHKLHAVLGPGWVR